ncbi:MAG TPA: hypothetical protein EYG38_07570, partial [Verrucomicrobia bacterium]|nr:hypothetical protein [Verrucomicrobiota bacterium]
MDTESAISKREQVAQFQQRHHVALLTLVFTDMVGSTRLKQDLGDRKAVTLMMDHHRLVREILKAFPEGEEISTAGDSFFIVFTKPSDATRFSLRIQYQLRSFSSRHGINIQDRIGIHVGEVMIQEQNEDSPIPRDLFGLQIDTCARIMSLAQPEQILLGRTAFDSARQVIRGENTDADGSLNWVNHGLYKLKGVEDPIEICEVGVEGIAPLLPPPDSEKVSRCQPLDGEPVLGWRPAVGITVPGTQWLLEQKLGEGGFGEVWVGHNRKLDEKRVFKFCFRADRVRSLKRELTLFRVLKEKVGRHPNIVGVQDVYFDEAPFYLIMDYAEAKDLKQWCADQGGIGKVSLAVRIEIIRQTVEALGAAHKAGIIHRDVKPANLLISGKREDPESIHVRLTDFGIGQVVSQEVLNGVTQSGFTETMAAGREPVQAGTYMYLAPELLAGKTASPASDIYSLGVVFYQLIVEDFSKPITPDWPTTINDTPFNLILKDFLTASNTKTITEIQVLSNSLKSVLPKVISTWKQEARNNVIK